MTVTPMIARVDVPSVAASVGTAWVRGGADVPSVEAPAATASGIFARRDPLQRIPTLRIDAAELRG